MSQRKIDVSVVILGSGLAGGVFAALLKKINISFAIIDPDSPKNMLDSVADGRTTAISLGSQKIFEKASLWTEELNRMASPIESIRVLEEDSVATLDFGYKDVGTEPMGYIIENMHIRKSILDSLKDVPTAYYQTSVINIKKEKNHVEVFLSNGIVIHAQLLVSAEGRKSPSRELIAPKMKSRDYAQKALVVHLEHEKSHQNRAWEIFTKNGPFAILPLHHPDGLKSGIVYAKPTNHDWNMQTDLMLEDEIENLFPYYGKMKIVSPRWHFPLSVFALDKIIGDRQALIGDAAHGMHPLAGQGVNLGWRDADVLADILYNYGKLGIDIGSSSLLIKYQKERQSDIKTLLGATDFMNQLFEHPSKSLYYLRNAGLALVNQIPPLKRFFMKRAMGIN